MEVGCAQSRSSIKDTMEVGANHLFVGSPRPKGDVSHGAMNHNGDGRLRGSTGKDNNVLMESNIARTMAQGMHTSGTGDGGGNAATVHGNHRTRTMLLKEHLATLGRDIFLIYHVKIPALVPLGMLTPPSQLKIFDLSRGLFAKARLICIGEANHIGSILLLRPWVWAVASKTPVLNKATLGGLTTLG
jgi:hypothetical protein